MPKGSSHPSEPSKPSISSERSKPCRPSEPPYPPYPSYRGFSRAELEARAGRAWALAEECQLCPRRCGAARRRGATGTCRVADQALVASYGPHFGEEPPLVGRRGSGAIFFGGCNLRCIYCQNFDISARAAGKPVSPRELAAIMLVLQEMGCHNVNLVSPTHVVAMILDALATAAGQGLSIPLVYNTGGYDSLELLAILDGVVDIYMPDMKYADAAIGLELSGIPDYPAVNRAAAREMHRQVGTLEVDEEGVARRGVIIRHLVLPGDLSGTAETLRFIAEEISPNSYVNIMAQYQPAHRAATRPPLDRRLHASEYRAALAIARQVGLRRLARE